MEECAYRLEVVSEFLKTGIPIGKIDMMQSLLEKNSYRLTGSSQLGQYISMALKQEIEQNKKELSLLNVVEFSFKLFMAIITQVLNLQAWVCFVEKLMVAALFAGENSVAKLHGYTVNIA